MAGKIFEAIPKIMSEVGGIEKNRKNISQGYLFRGIDDVYIAMQPLLSKYGVFCAPNVTDQIREERQSKNGSTLLYSILKVQFSFIADDGSSIVVTTIGEGQDSGDKASNKAMSAAYKVAMLQLFCIPTEEPKDSEYESHEVKPKVEQRASPPMPKPVAPIPKPVETEMDFNSTPDVMPAITVEGLVEVGKSHRWNKSNIAEFSKKAYGALPSKLTPESLSKLFATVSNKTYTDAMVEWVHAEDVV